jgi:hypothetical protein
METASNSVCPRDAGADWSSSKLISVQPPLNSWQSDSFSGGFGRDPAKHGRSRRRAALRPWHTQELHPKRRSALAYSIAYYLLRSGSIKAFRRLGIKADQELTEL